MSDKHGTIRESVRIIAPLVILAVGVGGFIFLKGRRDVPKRSPATQGPPDVDTATVEAHGDTLTIEVDGHVVPYREVVLSAEVAGLIETKEDVCRAGKFVKKNDPLLKIDSRDYQSEYDRLEEDFVQAGVMLDELEVQMAKLEKPEGSEDVAKTLIQLAEDDLVLAEAELTRQTGLLGDKATSQAAFDQVKRSVLQAQNSLATLRNELSLLKTRRARLVSAKERIRIQREQAGRDVERTKIRAPFDGMVIAESVEEKSYVQKGTPLVTLEGTSVVEVRCHLRMDELYWIWSQVSDQTADPDTETLQEDYQIPETPVTVVYRLAGQEYTWQGILWRYDGIGLDEKTRTVPCRVRIDSPRDVRIRTSDGFVEPATGPRALVRGMFVNLEIHAKPMVELVQVDEAAVQPGNKVWCVRDGKLESVDIQIVEIVDGKAVLRATAGSLDAGDKVVVSPLGEINGDTLVQEQEAPDEAHQLAQATEGEGK
jgi:multidrug efflux pump subunit AcrA (membrane-fusion protein)